MPGKRRMRYRARKAMAVSKKIKKYVNRTIDRKGEKKIVDLLVVNTAASPAGSMYYLSTIAEGDALNQRTGNQIKPIRLDFIVDLYDSTAGDEDGLRMIIFQYASSASAGVVDVPTFVDILQDEAIGGTANTNLSHPNYRNKNNYRILYDKYIELVGNSTVLGLNNSKTHVSYKGSVKKLSTIRFNGTGGTSASSGKGALFALFVSNNGHIFVNASFRLYYSDM